MSQNFIDKVKSGQIRTTSSYTNKEKISHIVSDSCKQIIANPKKLVTKEYDKYRVYPMGPISYFGKQICLIKKNNIFEYINTNVPIFLEKIIHDNNDSDSNFMFLLKLGYKRNWKSECVICLSDDMMGTTCKCGHTEIAVFRPCGHSVCVSPCFQDLVQTAKIELTRETITFGDQVFYVGNKMKIDGVNNFKCPTCRQNVEHTFRAENVNVPAEIRESDEYAKMISELEEMI